jgi:hypothetical protein
VRRGVGGIESATGRAGESAMGNVRELRRRGGVERSMKRYSTSIVLALWMTIVAFAPAVVHAASPAEEARLVAAVRKAFDEHKGAGLAGVTCWDGIGGADRKSAEGGYKALVEQKDVVWEFKLVEPDPKAVERARKEENGIVRRENLAIVRRLEMTFRDKEGKRILGIIGYGVGEKDGRLMLVAWAAGEK